MNGDLVFVRFKKLRPNARKPKNHKVGDAGFDLYATTHMTLHPMQRALVPTGIALEIPQGFYGRIAPRSGLALKDGIDVLAGVVDSTYRGEIGVVLINLAYPEHLGGLEAIGMGAGSFEIKPGDRIAQIIIERCQPAIFSEVKDLNNSDRGENSFGSSGLRDGDN